MPDRNVSPYPALYLSMSLCLPFLRLCLPMNLCLHRFCFVSPPRVYVQLSLPASRCLKKFRVAAEWKYAANIHKTSIPSKYYFCHWLFLICSVSASFMISCCLLWSLPAGGLSPWQTQLWRREETDGDTGGGREVQNQRERKDHSAETEEQRQSHGNSHVEGAGQRGRGGRDRKRHRKEETERDTERKRQKETQNQVGGGWLTRQQALCVRCLQQNNTDIKHSSALPIKSRNVKLVQRDSFGGIIGRKGKRKGRETETERHRKGQQKEENKQT